MGRVLIGFNEKNPYSLPKYGLISLGNEFQAFPFSAPFSANATAINLGYAPSFWRGEKAGF